MENYRSMKNRTFITIVIIILISGPLLMSQESNMEMKLSLNEAQEYALLNNRMVLSAKSDVLASRAALWETISAALPQVNASGSFADNLKLMTTLLPGEFFNQPGEKIPVTFGSQFNSSASVQASLLLFNAPLYIGIETTKLARKLSEENLEKSELDTKESVASAYYLILVSEKSLQILGQNIECILQAWLKRPMLIR